MRQFSAPHLAALVVLSIAAVAAVVVPRRCSDVVTTRICRGLALVILAAWAGEYVADVVDGIWTVRYDLPLQLTDVISVTAVVALWTRRPALTELVYLWSLSASLQATITPDLQSSFPSIYYFTYFSYHVGAVVAGVLLVFGCGLYPRPGAAARTFAVTVGVAACAGAANLITGGNYMYLRAKPAHGSLLSALGPWPWYLAGIALVGVAILEALQWIAGQVQRRDRRWASAGGAT